MGGEVSEKFPSLYVGIGVSTYKHKDFGPLPQAVAEVTGVADILKAHLYKVHVIKDPTSKNAPAKLTAALPDEILKKGGCLVIYWSGHGEPTPEGKLHLVLRDGKPRQTPLITSEYLAGLVARTGANQVLLVLDTCYSGKGAIPAVDTADRVLREIPPDAERVWFGVITSAMDFEQARDGVFGSLLNKLLREGPSHPELRLRWSSHNAGVRGDDLMDALCKEWDKEIPQRPRRASVGDPWIMFPNPHHNPDAPDRVVEHLLLAARGVAPGEEGIYFTGRVAQLSRIISWMRAGKPGVFVITGPAGSGKSAIAGRIVSLSNPAERPQLLARCPLEHADPGEGSVHAHVYARGVTAERLCQLIDEQLVRRGVIAKNPGGPRNKWELLGAIERTQKLLVLVIDGLEEAGAEAWLIAEEVIRLLAKESLVLLSTRELPPREEGGLSLIQTLLPVETIDLGKEAIQGETQSDVRLYVERRLGSVSGAMDPAKIADAIVHIDQTEREGLFLLARVITSQLRSDPVDTSVPGWEGFLDRGIEAAFEREISGITPLRRDGQQLPHAARELLTALAWAYGSGMPDDIWPIVATALSPTESTYQRDDVFWLLGQAGRYVVEGGEGGRAVYRLVHQRLVEHLRPRPITMNERTIEEEKATRIADALIQQYLQILEKGGTPPDYPYLRNYAWRHCADAGERGVKALRQLVYHKREAFLPDIAQALFDLGFRHSEAGMHKRAVALTEEAVAINRELAETNPAFLPALANSLYNLGIFHRKAGRRQDAVEPAEEAVKIYREIVEMSSIFLPNLAMSLGNLGICYSEVGKRKEAVAPMEESLRIKRKLAKTNPAFLPDLARCLYNLGFIYSQDQGLFYGQRGRLQEALSATEEAVEIYRKLAKTNAAFLRDLDYALCHILQFKERLSRNEEAVASTTEERVTSLRDLAESNPYFLPDLAMCLDNFSVRYSGVGKHEEAVAPTEEAVHIYRELAERNPAFLPNLARALNNLGNLYREVGRGEEAVAPTEEAVHIYRELAERNPAFLPDLAGSLNNLGIALMTLGGRKHDVSILIEARSAIESSQAIYRQVGYEQYDDYFQEKLHSVDSLIDDLQKQQ